MNRKRDMLTAALIASTLGFAAPIVFAQNAPGGQTPSRPGGPTGPTVPQPNPGVPNPGPTVPRPGPSVPPTEPKMPEPGRRIPQPDPGLPREIEPTIPGQPAPGLPQREPMPGGPGTIPERTQAPNVGPEDMVVTPSHVRKAQEALRTKGLNPGADGKMILADPTSAARFPKRTTYPRPASWTKKPRRNSGVNLKNWTRRTPNFKFSQCPYGASR